MRIVGSESQKAAPAEKAKVTDLPFVRLDNSHESSANTNVQLLAFGDFGSFYRKFIDTMEMYHTKFQSRDAVLLLGDNAYKAVSEAEEYDVYFNHVARGSQAPHYAILGNFEYILGTVDFMLSMPSVDSSWVTPSKYYFERIDHDLCLVPGHRTPGSETSVVAY
jgi:hypothetical protein